MVNVVLESIEDEQIKNWYKENTYPTFLGELVEENWERGYSLDLRSGLFFRRPYSEKIMKELGYTVADIIFPRPVNLHHHEDVGEALRVVRGKGVLYTRSETGGVEKSFCTGKEAYVPRGMTHSFRPDKNSFLEVRLACSGILDDKKEICEKRFFEFPLWVKYFEKLKQ